MEALHQPVALWMECGGELVVDATLFAQGLPGGGGELTAPIRDDGGGKTEDRNPVVEQGFPHGLGGDLRDWHGHRVPRGAIYHSKHVPAAPGLPEGAHQIDVDGAEPLHRDRYLLYKRVLVTIDLASLAS